MRYILSRLIAVYATACSTAAALTCQEMLVPVDISANNTVLPSNLTSADFTVDFILNTVANLETAVVGGQYNINVRYCEPTTVVASRQQTLQVLVHGGTYTRNYWSGLAAPGTLPGQDEYSWIVYAANQGYPTLSIDRLCNGNSSHPNSLLCQFPLQMEALHAVITKARSGAFGGRAFQRIIVAGHSFGSLLVNELAHNYPNDPDALLLTSFSFNLIRGLAAPLNFNLLPASVAEGGQYANLDPGYLSITRKSGFQGLFYYGSFEQSELDYDFAHPGTTSLGEFATFYLPGQAPVPNYDGPLFVLNGNNDAAFCQTDPTEPITGPLGQPPNCSLGYTEDVHTFYPAVSRFDFHNTPNTDHCFNLHTTAQESFAAAHQFLQSAGF